LPDQQVVYEIPGVSEIETQKEQVYLVDEISELTFDTYRPIASPTNILLPVVIFVFGFADSVMLEKRGYRLKDAGQYVSWSRLVAASGCAAITYETNQPERDILKLIHHIQQNAESLQIDRNKIGLWACSGNVPTALSVLMQEVHDYLKCIVMYYGAMLDWQGSQFVADAAAEAGFANPCQVNTFDDLPNDVPMMIVRAGHDYPPLNETINRFLAEAVTRNLPLTFINHPTGKHGFDILDETLYSQRIIKQTLAFIRGHLSEKDE
jgi:hypothetical protein